MPSSRDLYLEWNSDLVLTPQGSIQLSQGWDLVRQRIVRNLITNSAQALPDGSTTAPDYIFHSTFGLGLGAMVGQTPDESYQQALVARANRAVQSDVGTMPGIPPTVNFSEPAPGTFVMSMSITLSNNQVGKISVTVTK